MPIPALMTTPYAGATPAARPGRGGRAAPATDTNTALQIMQGLRAGENRPAPAPSTQDNLASGMRDVFADLRAPQADFNPASVMGDAPSLSFGDESTLANAGIYKPGSFGDQNARANGTGFKPESMMTPARSNIAETRSFTGGDTLRADGIGLNNGLDTYDHVGGNTGGSRRGTPVDMMYGQPAGTAAAIKIDDMRTGLDAWRSQQLNVSPALTMLTPGLTPVERNTKLALDADRQRETGVPPEMAGARFGYLDKLALRTAGAPEAMSSGRAVYRGTDAAGRPTLSETDAPIGADDSMPTADRPLTRSAADQNRSAVEMMAAGGRQAMQAARTPSVVDLGTDANGKRVQGVRQPDGRVEVLHSKEDYPRQVDAGGRKLIEVSAGKFTDEKGKPVEWRADDDRPLNVNEFLMSPALSEKFGGDYSKYREAHAAATKSTSTPAAAAGAEPAAATAPAPAITYNHEDLQAELKRRGLTK